MTRRDFVKTSTLAAGAALGFPTIIPSTVLGENAPSNRLAMGAIGLGGQGTHNMRSFLSRTSEVQMLAVCDVDRYHRDAAKGIIDQQYKNGDCATYNDFRELLARDDIDAVICCPPDHWHALVVIAAAKAGKDIYCEKPFAATIAEGRAAADAIKRYGRILQVGSQERSGAKGRFGCELAASGRLGQLRSVTVNLPTDHRVCPPQPEQPIPDGFDYNMWLGPAPWAPYTQLRCHFHFRYILDYTPGELIDRGAHVGDLAQWGSGHQFTGPVELEGKGEFPPDGLFNTAIEFELHGKYANGVKLNITSQQPRGVKFEGDEGWVFIHIHGGDLEASNPALLKTPLRPDEFHLYDDTNNHHQNFLDCIRTRRQPIAPAEGGHRTASLCHLANIALLLGRKLHWDPDKEQFLNDDAANAMVARPMRQPWSIS